MPVITAIEVQKKNPGRVNIYIDDEFAFGLARIVAAWLKVGQQLTKEKIASLIDEDAHEQALQKSLHYLGYRARSVNEVRKNLQKHEIPDAVIEDTLIKLQNNGLIGDEEFARTWVENRSTFRPRGRRALAVELRQKGLPDNIIQTTLDETVDEEALALDAGRKYARKLEKLERLEFRKKLSGFLARRGFSYEVASPVIRQVWEELHTGQATIIENED
jgi:regulatory protein